MRTNAPSADVVIEWAPGSATAYDLQSKKVISGASLLDIAPKLNSRDVVVGVSRRACFIRTLMLPDAPKEDLLQGLSTTIAQHVPIESGDACVDLRLQGIAGSQGRPGTLIAMRAGDLRRLREEARQAGLRILATVPAAFGSWVLANATSLQDCAAVSETTDGMAVDLIADGELRYSRALGKEATNGRLAPEILRTFMAAGMEASPTLAQGLRLPAAQYTVEKTPLEALAGVAWSLPGVEFELPEVLAAKKRTAQNQRSRIATSLWVVAIILVCFAYFEYAQAQAKVDRVARQSASVVNATQLKVDDLSSRHRAALEMQQILDQGFKPAQRLGDVLALLSNRLPKGAWLTNVSVQRGQSVSIRGTALAGEDVTAYVDALAKEPRLRDVRLEFANNALIESTPVVNFSISAFPVGNLPLVEKTKAKGGKR